jgi:hypothetical protein
VTLPSQPPAFNYLQAEARSGGAAASSRGEEETAREEGMEEGWGQRAERKRRAVSINSGARGGGRPAAEGAARAESEGHGRE